MALALFCHLNHHRILLCAKLGSGGVERVREKVKGHLKLTPISFLIYYSMYPEKSFRNCTFPSDCFCSGLIFNTSREGTNFSTIQCLDLHLFTKENEKLKKRFLAAFQVWED